MLQLTLAGRNQHCGALQRLEGDHDGNIVHPPESLGARNVEQLLHHGRFVAGFLLAHAAIPWAQRLDTAGFRHLRRQDQTWTLGRSTHCEELCGEGVAWETLGSRISNVRGSSAGSYFSLYGAVCNEGAKVLRRWCARTAGGNRGDHHDGRRYGVVTSGKNIPACRPLGLPERRPLSAIPA